MGGKNWFEISRVLKNRGFEKSGGGGQNYSAWLKQIQGKRAMVQKIKRLKKSRVRKIGIPLCDTSNDRKEKFNSSVDDTYIFLS